MAEMVISSFSVEGLRDLCFNVYVHIHIKPFEIKSLEIKSQVLQYFWVAINLKETTTPEEGQISRVIHVHTSHFFTLLLSKSIEGKIPSFCTILVITASVPQHAFPSPLLSYSFQSTQFFWPYWLVQRWVWDLNNSIRIHPETFNGTMDNEILCSLESTAVTITQAKSCQWPSLSFFLPENGTNLKEKS